jgi:dihydrolipoamide dehydrogenase
VIEVLPRILPAEDYEISKVARADLNDKEFYQDHRKSYEHQARSRRTACATVESGGAPEELAADAVVVVAGVQVNIENLRLEELGVRLDRGSIAVDGCGRTTVPEATWSGPQCSRIEPNTNLCMRRGPSRDSDASR